jgi:hypothetical protein
MSLIVDYNKPGKEQLPKINAEDAKGTEGKATAVPLETDPLTRDERAGAAMSTH